MVMTTGSVDGYSSDFVANNYSIVWLDMNRFFSFILISSFITAAAVAQNAAPQAATPSESKGPDAKSAQPAQTVDKAVAYYHYTLAHLYEEQVTSYGRSELASKAMEEYRLGIEADPSSEFLASGLAG